MGFLRKDPRSVAERAARSGDWLTAASLFEEAGDLYRALDGYEKGGDFERAAELASRLGRDDVAASLFRKSGDLHRAALLLRRLGKELEAAEAFLEAGFVLDAASLLASCGERERASELYEREGHYERAAELLSQAERHERAGELFARAGQFLASAASFEKAGLPLRAGEIHEKSGRYTEAASAYAKAGLPLRAAELFERRVLDLSGQSSYPSPKQRKELELSARGAAHYFERAGELDRAARALERAEMFEPAAQLVERLADFARAGELHRRAGNLEKAAAAYARAGMAEAAAKLEAEHHLNEGNEAAAADALLRAGDTGLAASMFSSLGLHERALDCYVALESWGKAAEAALASGQGLRAAELFERAGDAGTSARLFRDAGETARAAPLFASAGRFFEAAQAAADANDERGMIDYLQRVPEVDPRHADSIAILARAFLARGWSALAIEKLEAALKGKPVDGSNLELWDAFADALEQSGELERSAELLRKILSVSFGFRDAEARHARVLSRIEEEKTRERSFGVGLTATGDAPYDGERYELGELVGRGGMGEVYRAFDRLLSRTVAYKVLSAELARDVRARDQLLLEARAAAALNHPNIVTVYDLGVQHGRPFIAMELIDGESYAILLMERKTLPLPDLMHLLVSVSQGLDHAHHRGIVHRDLKPSNLLLTTDERVKILDFGLAQPVSRDPSDSSGSSHGGTPKYIAPEQALGEPTDARTDIYSLGVTLFELGCGRAPFVGGDLFHQHVHVPPPRLRSVLPDAPEALDELVAHCLAKSPAERFQSAGEVISFARAAGLL